MSSYYYVSHNEDYLAHHGILGMKWGVRRYQNEDGTLTSLGRQHYGRSEVRDRNTFEKALLSRKIRNSSSWEKSQTRVKNELEKLPQEKIEKLLSSRKELLKSVKAWNAMLDSKAFDELSEKTYHDTVKWFRQNDPEHLDKIVKKYGKNLDYDGSFSKKFEGTRNSRLQETSEYKEREKAGKAYEEERDAVAKDLIGKKGSKRVSSSVDRYQVTSVDDLVNTTIDIWAYDKIK